MKTTGRQWAGRTAVVGTVFIALGAFWLSFTALADLAARSGVDRGQAWAWPLIVDGIIVVATVAVVALAGQRSAWYPWSLLVGGALVSVTANAIHAVVAADADVPGLLAASVAAVPPVVLLAITHLTVILTRTFPQELPGQPEVLSEIPEMLSEVYAGPQGVVHSKSLLSVASEPLADERELSLASDETPGRSDRRARAAALRAAAGRTSGLPARCRCIRQLWGDGSPPRTFPTPMMTPPASGRRRVSASPPLTTPTAPAQHRHSSNGSWACRLDGSPIAAA